MCTYFEIPSVTRAGGWLQSIFTVNSTMRRDAMIQQRAPRLWTPWMYRRTRRIPINRSVHNNTRCHLIIPYVRSFRAVTRRIHYSYRNTARFISQHRWNLYVRVLKEWSSYLIYVKSSKLRRNFYNVILKNRYFLKTHFKLETWEKL